MFKKLIKTIGVVGCKAGLLLPSIGAAHAATSNAIPETKANSSIFGPNVYVFNPSMSNSKIQSIASSIK